MQIRGSVPGNALDSTVADVPFSWKPNGMLTDLRIGIDSAVFDNPQRSEANKNIENTNSQGDGGTSAAATPIANRMVNRAARPGMRPRRAPAGRIDLNVH